MIQFLAGAAAFIVALAGLSAAIGVAAKSSFIGRPIRWLWQRNVADPFDGWVRHTVGDVVDVRINHLMHNHNSGSSLLDLAESLNAVKTSVDMLLEHDAERDTVGNRYGPDHSQEEE